MERRRRIALAIVGGLVALLVLLWLARAWVATQFVQSYFRAHAISSSVEVGTLGLSGASGRFMLGRAEAPEISATHIELYFDPLSWIPKVVEVRLVDPVVRAQVGADGKITLPSLQTWLDSLNAQPGQSRWVSADLAVSLTNLRALLDTPGGSIEIFGDARLVRNQPVSAHLAMRPAQMAWQGVTLTLQSANLDYTPARAALTARFSAHKDAVDVHDANLSLDIIQPRWSATMLSAPSLRLHFAADSVTAGRAMESPVLELEARHPVVKGGDISADIAVNGAAGFEASEPAAIRTQDPVLAKTIAANLSHITASISGHLTRQNNKATFTPSAPLILEGAKGAVLRVTAPSIVATPDSVTASPALTLSGDGLPNATLALRDMVWRNGELTAQAALQTRFNFAMLRNAAIRTDGAVTWQAGRFTFTPAACMPVTLSAFRPGASDLVSAIHATICPDAQPLFTLGADGWHFLGIARELTAKLLTANAQLDQGQAKLTFADQNGAITGSLAVTNARLTDLTPAPRFKPLSADGSITLANWVWRGRMTARDAHKQTLATVDFTHKTASGAGTAHIVADKLTFAPEKLQPEDLSPLLAALKRTEGTAHFDGTLDWTRAAITSHGKLSIDSLDFMTMLGKAHAVKTDITFTSLLPPVTAPGQDLTISRIDWTLPFSNTDLRFGFGPDTLKVEGLSMNWAEGHAALSPFTVKLADPSHVTGAADLKSIALSSLIAVSNLGSKAKLEGKVSGHLPFAVTPEGLRIAGGHLEADGPGRLSIDRSLWMQGDAAIASNAVQDFAYQALENLAFDQMSADLNSVANGRLQIVFHIKGKSDPPKRQTADVAIMDIINGTALYKPIPLPSGTPIDLTLDTSLNFDELLKSYAEAWSKSLSPTGQPDAMHGAKP